LSLLGCASTKDKEFTDAAPGERVDSTHCFNGSLKNNMACAKNFGAQLYFTNNEKFLENWESSNVVNAISHISKNKGYSKIYTMLYIINTGHDPIADITFESIMFNSEKKQISNKTTGNCFNHEQLVKFSNFKESTFYLCANSPMFDISNINSGDTIKLVVTLSDNVKKSRVTIENELIIE